MEVFLIRALQLILCLSILVFLHEGGHFLAAKLFKIRVEKFALFFDPWFNLFSFKPKKSDTRYVLGWLPLGGYVKISGMIDESMDTEQMKQSAQPWEFRAKPAWQRLIVMLAGVIVNFIVALFIYAMILFVWGDTYVPIENVKDGFKFNETAQQYGFRDGDIPLRTNEVTFTRFDNTQSIGNVYRAISEATSCTVLRNGREVILTLPGKMNMLDMMKHKPPFMLELMPSVIDSVVAGSAAAKAGIQAGDKVVGFNGKSISTWNEFTLEKTLLAEKLNKKANDMDHRTMLQRVFSHAPGCSPKDSLAIRTVTLAVAHKDGSIDTLEAQLDAQLSLGATWTAPREKYEKTHINYNFLAAFPAGIKHGIGVFKGYIDDLKYLFTKDGAKSIGSFGAIGSLFPTTWDWQRFWELTAFISLMLAFMNVLPIPALDGGHALFLVAEVITRRKPSEKFMEMAEKIGMSFLLLLMAYAIFNDLIHFAF